MNHTRMKMAMLMGAVSYPVIGATLDDDIAEVAAQKTRIGSLTTLFASTKKQLADALSGVTLPPAVQAKVDKLFEDLHANSGDIDAALNADVPPPA